MKKEQTLIKKRGIRKNELHIWRPEQNEFWDICLPVWNKVLLNIKSKSIRQKAFENIQLVQKSIKDTKIFENQNYLFAEFVGSPRSRSTIIIYTEDICVVNFFQKDLFKDHLYFILEHELKHYFGKTHEDMENIKEFNY